ncbi:hypothetical protein M758_8G185500 [Ceratodon purpureus]|nr:hypothetical protein M758_8G185500 [Ceratodon purpureus]
MSTKPMSKRERERERESGGRHERERHERGRRAKEGRKGMRRPPQTEKESRLDSPNNTARVHSGRSLDVASCPAQQGLAKPHHHQQSPSQPNSYSQPNRQIEREIGRLREWGREMRD